MFVVKRFFSRTLSKMNVSYLTQQQSKTIDEELFNDYKFSVDQLMELAGLSCASVIGRIYNDKTKYSNCLIVAGGGNNGGDGLVCARHLKLFGFNPTVVYPKRTDKDLYRNLVRQCEKMHIAVLHQMPTNVDSIDLIVDAIFGFGFAGEIRSPFDEILRQLKQMESSKPIVSIDVPSGWDVEKGATNDQCLQPECVVSLTAPKLCMKTFNGKYHFLGGRFLPDDLKEKYQLILPSYPSTDQIVQL